MKAGIKKKTYNLDEEMIDKVRRLFSVKTDTEAIQKALQKTLEDQEVQESLDRLLREGASGPFTGEISLRYERIPRGLPVRAKTDDFRLIRRHKDFSLRVLEAN